MSQPAVAALAPLPFELVYSDGEPLESEWHAMQFPLLMEVIRQAMAEQGRTDFYVGGDMFVYYSIEQAWDVKKGRPYFRGPDAFWVGGVSGHMRKCWVSWEEGGRLPDVIVELLSPSTAEIDRTVKKDLYARVFGTKEYYLYDPEVRRLEGFGLADRVYQPRVPDEQGRLWSEELGVFLGPWHGVWQDRDAGWVRLFRPDGTLVPTKAEAAEQRADAAEQRADAAEQRADAAEAEAARLRALLAERGQPPRK